MEFSRRNCVLMSSSISKAKRRSSMPGTMSRTTSARKALKPHWVSMISGMTPMMRFQR